MNKIRKTIDDYKKEVEQELLNSQESLTPEVFTELQALTLYKANSDDLKALAERYSNIPTAIKIIKQHAENAGYYIDFNDQEDNRLTQLKKLDEFTSYFEKEADNEAVDSFMFNALEGFANTVE